MIAGGSIRRLTSLQCRIRRNAVRRPWSEMTTMTRLH